MYFIKECYTTAHPSLRIISDKRRAYLPFYCQNCKQNFTVQSDLQNFCTFSLRFTKTMKHENKYEKSSQFVSTQDCLYTSWLMVELKNILPVFYITSYQTQLVQHATMKKFKKNHIVLYPFFKT